MRLAFVSWPRSCVSVHSKMSWIPVRSAPKTGSLSSFLPIVTKLSCFSGDPPPGRRTDRMVPADHSGPIAQIKAPQSGETAAFP